MTVAEAIKEVRAAEAWFGNFPRDEEALGTLRAQARDELARNQKALGEYTRPSYAKHIVTRTEGELNTMIRNAERRIAAYTAARQLLQNDKVW